MVVRVQAGPVFPGVGHKVVVAVTRPGLVGARRALVKERHLDIVGQAVAIGVDVVAAVQIQDHSLDDGVVAILQNEKVRAVDERAPETVGDNPAFVVALDDLAVEDVGVVAAVPGQFILLPVQAGAGGGAGGPQLEERQFGHIVAGRLVRAVQHQCQRGIGPVLHRDVLGGGALVDLRTWIGVVVFGGAHGDGVGAGGKPGKREAEGALHHLIGRLFGAAIDGDKHLVGGEVGVVDGQQGIALEGGRTVQHEFGPVPVDVHNLGLGVENGGIGGIALGEGAGLDDMQAFGQVRGGDGHRIDAAGGGAVHVVETPGNTAAVHVEPVGDPQLDPGAPLEHDVVHGDAGRHIGGFGFDRDRVAGDAHDLLGAVGDVVRGAAGMDPRHGGGGSSIFLEHQADAIGAQRRIHDPALTVVARHADVGLAAADRDLVPVVAGKVFQDGAVGEGAVQVVGDVSAGIIQGQDHDAFARVGLAVAVQVIVALECEEVGVVVPAFLFIAAGEVLVDPNQVGEGAFVGKLVEGVVVVAGIHPGSRTAGSPRHTAVVGPGDVVARVVHHGHPDVAEDVGIGEIRLGAIGQDAVVTPDIGDPGGGPEVRAEGAESGQVAGEAGIGGALHLGVEETHWIAGALAVPVFDLGPG